MPTAGRWRPRSPRRASRIRLSAPGTLEWATPVLYMRAADGALFGDAPPERHLDPGARAAVDAAVLRRVLVARFSLNELLTLCGDLGVDFDNLGGEGKVGKARELIDYLQRLEGREGLARLVAAVLKARPGAAGDLGLAPAARGSPAPPPIPWPEGCFHIDAEVVQQKEPKRACRTNSQCTPAWAPSRCGRSPPGRTCAAR